MKSQGRGSPHMPAISISQIIRRIHATAPNKDQNARALSLGRPIRNQFRAAIIHADTEPEKDQSVPVSVQGLDIKVPINA